MHLWMSLTCLCLHRLCCNQHQLGGMNGKKTKEGMAFPHYHRLCGNPLELCSGDSSCEEERKEEEEKDEEEKEEQYPLSLFVIV